MRLKPDQWLFILYENPPTISPAGKETIVNTLAQALMQLPGAREPIDIPLNGDDVAAVTTHRKRTP